MCRRSRPWTTGCLSHPLVTQAGQSRRGSNTLPSNDNSRCGTAARGRAAARPGDLRGPAAALLAGPAHGAGRRLSRSCAGHGLSPGGDRGAQLPRPAGGPATAGPAAPRRPPMVPAPADAGLCHLRRHVRRRPERGRRPGGLPGGAGRDLSASDAAAQAAPRTVRRRLRGDGLPRGTRGPRHHRRPAGPGHDPPVAGHLAHPGPGTEPCCGRAPMGGQRPQRRPLLPGLLLHVRRSDPARRVRAVAARGVSRISPRATSPSTRSPPPGSGPRSTAGSGT